MRSHRTPIRPGTSRACRTDPRRSPALIGLLLAIVVVVSASACSSDDSPAAVSPSTTVAAERDDATTTTEDADAPDESDDDSGDEAALTSEDICDAVSVDAVAEATGLEITGAEPSTSSTPQCAYTYTSTNGPDSNLTVAASRYTSSDAQSIEEAYDSAVQINISTAGGTSVDQTEVDAGDEAIVLAGEFLELGVVRVGDVLASVIVPPGAVTPAQTEALLVAVGDAFA